MREIIAGEGIEQAFLEIGVNALMTYRNQNSDLAVWSVDDESFKKLARYPSEKWKKQWGWWRTSSLSPQMHDIKMIIINDNWISAWVKDTSDDEEYNSLSDYLDQMWGITEITVFTKLVVDLAVINNMSVAALMSKYQGGHPL